MTLSITWITGATGYLGRSLMNARLPLFESEAVVLLVRATDPKLAGPGRVIVRPEQPKVGFTLGELQDLARKHPPRRIIHFATEFRNAYDPSESQSMLASNLDFPVAMLEACRSIQGLQVLNFGTYFSHSADGESPATFYAATKSAFESFLSFYVLSQSWSAITLKIFDTYGPADPRPKLIPKLVEALKTQVSVQLSPGEQKLSLIHVDDVVSAVSVALSGFEFGKHRIFQLPAAPDPDSFPSLREIVATLDRVAQRKVPVLWSALPYRKNEIMKPRLGFPILPGWSPKITLAEGLKRLVS